MENIGDKGLRDQIDPDATGGTKPSKKLSNRDIIPGKKQEVDIKGSEEALKKTEQKIDGEERTISPENQKIIDAYRKALQKYQKSKKN